MLFKYIKFIFFLSIAVCFYVIALFFGVYLGREIVNYIIFPLVFITLNYAFIKLILYYIRYYNNLIILYKEQIIVIKSTLLDTDNFELIDLHKTTKIDAYCDGIVANFVGYGTLVIEQQSDKIREFWYVPKPYKAIGFLNEARERIIKERAGGYLKK